MIILKRLSWSNAFSYGQDNYIEFTENVLTQLVGANGHGKSSIALILEEVLFNKNSKNVKKGDILNWNSNEKFYEIELEFSSGNSEYKIYSKRASTQQVKLFKNGEDISAHTATATYKSIEDILGFDHKTFTQLVYQSHSSSLEFLRSPDTARKKFLAELLNLGKYTQIGDVFKQVNADLTKTLATLQGKIDSSNSWLTKYKGIDFTKKLILTVPEIDPKLPTRVSELEFSLKNLAGLNKRISQNNTYKKLQSEIEVLPIPSKPDTEKLQSLKTELALNNAEISRLINLCKSISAIKNSECPTCTQTLSSAKSSEILENNSNLIDALKDRIQNTTKEISKLEVDVKRYNELKKLSEDFEKYHQLIDTTLDSEILNEEELKTELDDINSELKKLKVDIARIEKENKENNAYNSKLDLLASQVVDMTVELESNTSEFNKINNRLAVVGTLVKTFSTTGLVAYKIENLIKELEDISNNYLLELSDGRFQISFQMTETDKLSVVITDNGRDIDIYSLSAGETARVNVAVLLAIRKLMQGLSNSRINLLFLDETMATLDDDGKERLIQLLLVEENLNTILVTHSYTHPLLEKISVSKTNNISKIIRT